VKVDRAYVFELRNDDGAWFASQRYEWSADGTQPQIDNPELQDVPMADIAPHWIEIFSRGEVYFATRSNYRPEERDTLESQHIEALLVCPIEVSGELWGFIGFDDCRRERTWKPEERRLLARLANVFATVLRHHTLKARLAAARNAVQGALSSFGAAA